VVPNIQLKSDRVEVINRFMESVLPSHVPLHLNKTQSMEEGGVNENYNT
jgi:hypothetical protein